MLKWVPASALSENRATSAGLYPVQEIGKKFCEI